MAGLNSVKALTAQTQVAMSMFATRTRDSFVASARRITKTTSVSRNKQGGVEVEAWDMRALVGELRFVTNAIASKGSKARLYVGKKSARQEDKPKAVESGPAFEAWSAFCDNVDLAGFLKKALANYQIPGICWFVGVPETMLPDADEYSDPDTYCWYVLSRHEVKEIDENTVELCIEGKRAYYDKNAVQLFETWQPHPDDSSVPDSGVLSAMPILREIVGLTMHVSAQIDSRLTGAGLLVLPQSATMAVESGEDDELDPFTQALLDAMETAYSDRSSAAAMVPITVTVPDDATGKFEHLKFWSELDAEARPLREEAIRRLALALDCPPEFLLGTADLNHWGAWVSREETVSNHIEPLLDIVVRALTTQFLWPMLTDVLGMDKDKAKQYVIYYDTTHLISRSNRTQDALQLHARGVISDEALRDVADFDEADAPVQIVTDPAMKVALDLVKASPALASNPGISALVLEIQAMIDAQNSGGDIGRAYTPPEEATSPDNSAEQPAEGLPPGEGGTAPSESEPA